MIEYDFEGYAKSFAKAIEAKSKGQE